MANITHRSEVILKAKKGRNRWTPYLLSMPALLVMIGIMYPWLTGVYWSLTKYNLSSGLPPRFIGIKNYITMFTDPNFLYSFWLTVSYILITLLPEIIIGLGIAILLNKESRTVRFLRPLMVMPLMMPPVVSALMWRLMMTPNGLLNWFLGLFGLSPLEWLASPKLALFSVAMIDIWMYTPFAILIFLASLQSLPHEIYEAAMVDGANGWQLFWRLTLPLISPFIMLILIFRGIDSLKVFDLIYSTTMGGPGNATNTLHIAAYYQGIRWFNFGNAEAYLTVLWILAYVLCYFLVKKWLKATHAIQGN